MRRVHRDPRDEELEIRHFVIGNEYGLPSSGCPYWLFLKVLQISKELRERRTYRLLANTNPTELETLSVPSTVHSPEETKMLLLSAPRDARTHPLNPFSTTLKS